MSAQHPPNQLRGYIIAGAASCSWLFCSAAPSRGHCRTQQPEHEQDEIARETHDGQGALRPRTSPAQSHEGQYEGGAYHHDAEDWSPGR
jgi:hypothetical protein